MPLPLELPRPSADQLEEGDCALSEAFAISQGVDLSNRAALNQMNALLRSDRVDAHVHRLLIVALYTVAAMVLVMFAVMVANMVMPARLRFLTPADVADLQKLLFSGALGSFISAAGQKVSRPRGHHLAD